VPNKPTDSRGAGCLLGGRSKDERLFSFYRSVADSEDAFQTKVFIDEPGVTNLKRVGTGAARDGEDLSVFAGRRRRGDVAFGGGGDGGWEGCL